MKYCVCCLILVLLAFVTNGCGGKSAPEAVHEPGRHYDKERGFSIMFPEGWSLQEENEGATIAALSPLENDEDMFYECVSVTIEQLPHEMSLDELYKESEAAIRRDYDDVYVDETGDLDINGIPSKYISFSYTMPQGIVQSKVFCLVNGLRGYFVHCDSENMKYAYHADVLEGCAKTFKFE